MKNLFILIALLVFTFSALKAEDQLTAKDLEALESIDYDMSVKSVEANLKIRERDDDTGLLSKEYGIFNDSSRISALYHINTSPTNATALTSIEFNYAKKLKYSWLELSYVQTATTFAEVAQNNEMATALTSDQLLEGSSTITSFAVGFGYRTSLIQNIIQSDRYFESISAMATYNSFSDELMENSFRGFGLKTDFGIHKRISSSIHLGVKFSYNLATVQREATEGEVSSDTSLNLNWVSFALDGSIYF